MFTKNTRKFSGFAIIKRQVVKYLAIVLLQPKIEGQYDFICKRSSSKFVESIKSHISKVLDCTYAFRNFYLIELDFYACSSQNTERERFLQILSKNPRRYSRLSMIAIKYLLKQLTYADLEWNMYTNAKTQQSQVYLYACKKKQLIALCFLLVPCGENVNFIGKYLQVLKVSLKYLRCILYKYVKNFVHLLDLDCIIKKNSIYLFKPSNRSLRNLAIRVRQKLYHKNQQGCWRINGYVNTSKAALDVKRLLFFWRTYYLSILSSSDAIKVNQITDYALYKWQVK